VGVGEYIHEFTLMIWHGEHSGSLTKLLREQRRAKRNWDKVIRAKRSFKYFWRIEAAAYQTLIGGTPVDSRNDVLVQFLYSRLRKRIAAAINDLPKQERLVLTLYYYEKLSLAEIGITIG
jgi:DNA-directed RNA polymerase specialized sigma subunit